MSLLPQQTNINQDRYFFLRATGQTLNVSSLTANTISTNTLSANSTISRSVSTITLDANDINTSTLFAYELFIDNQGLTANPTDLLLNGVPVATTANLSSIQDWAIFPATSTINAAGNNLISTNNLITSNIQAGNGVFGNLFANNIFALSTYTSTISSLAEVADFGFFSTLSSGNASIGSADISGISTGSITGGTANFNTLWGQPSSFYQDSISSLATGDIVCSTLVAKTLISTPDLEVSSINGHEFTENTATISSIITNQISSVFGDFTVNLVSTLQFNPSFSPNLDVNLGLGSLFGNLAGAASGAIGVVVGGAGLGTGIAALTQSRQTNNINSNVYELVNGTTQLQISTLGTSFSTIYRFVSSSGENVPGEEYFVSTIHSPGVAIRSLSDPLNTVSSPNSTIQSFGQWVALDANLPIPSTISSFDQLYTSSFAVSSIVARDGVKIDVRSAVHFSTGIALDGGGSGSGNDGANLDNWQAINVGTVSTDAIGGLTTNFIDVFQNIKNDGYQISTSQLLASSINGGIPYTTANPQPIVFSTANISSITGLSSIAFRAPGATYTLSSILNIVPGAGGTSQTSTLAQFNTDLSVGTNDIICGQVRIGGTATGTGEIVMTAPDSRVFVYDVNTGDRTLRQRLGTNPAISTGYVLDTYQNPPFFSTINGQVNLMAFFPSTTQSTIGVSTLSIIPAQAQNTGTFSTLNVSTLQNFQSTLFLQHTTSGANFQLNYAGDIIGVAPNGYVNFQAISTGTTVAGYLLNSGGNAGSSSNYTAGPMYLNASSIRMSTNQVQCVQFSTANIGVSTINNLPVVFQPTSAFSSNILWTNLSTSSNCIASTSISVQSPSYILAQANTSVKNTTNQYHTSYAYLTVNGFTSPSTITTAANNNGSFAGQSIAFRTAVSTGTYNVALFAYADTNGDLQVAQSDIWATGNLA